MPKYVFIFKEIACSLLDWGSLQWGLTQFHNCHNTRVCWIPVSGDTFTPVSVLEQNTKLYLLYDPSWPWPLWGRAFSIFNNVTYRDTQCVQNCIIMCSSLLLFFCREVLVMKSSVLHNMQLSGYYNPVYSHPVNLVVWKQFEDWFVDHIMMHHVTSVRTYGAHS